MYKEIQLDPSKTHRLACFEEAAGILHEIMEQDGILNIRIGQIQVILPLGLAESLRPLIGQRIAILHTDIAAKQYLFRLLDQETTGDCISI